MKDKVHLSADDGPVDAALVDYFERVDRGESVELTEIIAAHPGCEEGLRQFLKRERNLHATSLVAVTHENQARRTHGDFRLVRELGRGGMGVVYEAEQISLSRRVALKVLPFAAMLDKQQLARFKNEARAAATLDHPNIVAVHSVGSDGGVHYYAMQFIEGRSLAQVVAQLRARSTEQEAPSRTPTPHAPCPVPAADTAPVAALSTLHAPSSSLPAFNSREYYRTVARLGIQAAEALDHAHQNGILHRDIKPGNLMLDVDGKLYVTDFGLARIEAEAGMTMTGDVLGTLRYMSPEQALAKRVVVDHRSDIYSLGATLYELLTLQPAFGETDRSALLKQIAFDEPRPPRQINRRILVELETIVLKAMRKSPEQRYVTAHALADDLQRFLEQKPIRAKPPTWRERGVKWSQRHPAAIWAAILFLLATTAVTTVSAVLIANAYNREAEQRKLAETERERTEKNFDQARGAVRSLLDDAARGREEWSELTPALRKKFSERAIGFYESILQEKSSDASHRYETAVAYRTLAQIHYANTEVQQSVTLINQSITILDRLCDDHPDTTTYQYQLAFSNRWLGLTLWRQGEPAAAEAVLEKAVSLYKLVIPKEPDVEENMFELREICRWLDKLHGRRGDLSRAWKDEIVVMYRDVASRAPESANAHAYLGFALADAGHPVEAIVAFREAIRLRPKIYRLRNDIGCTLADKGMLDEAIAELREVIRLEPMEPVPHYNLGNSLAKRGLQDESISQLREAIRLQPEEPIFHAGLGGVLHDKGQFDEATSEYQLAIAAFREAIRLRQNDSDRLNRIAWILATCRNSDLRDPREAVQLATKAVKLMPAGPTWHTLGVAHYRSGNHRDAIEALQKSCELDEDAPSTFFFLAMSNWQLGNRDAASESYAKAMDWMEQHPQIVAGEYHRFRVEAEKLLGVAEPASMEAESATEKHPNDKSPTTAQQEAGQ